jgi:hypothetical protein
VNLRELSIFAKTPYLTVHIRFPYHFAIMAPSLKIFSLEGKGLKLDTAADVEPHIKPLREMEDVQEVRFLGNTLGVEACKVLGEVLETKKSLQVRSYCPRIVSW